MEEIGMSILSAYDKRRYKGSAKTNGDKIIEDQKTRAILSKMLGAEVPCKLEDGTVVNMTTRELIVLATLENCRTKADINKLQTLMVVEGEIDDNAKNQVNISLVDSDLEKRALGNNVAKEEREE